MNEKNTLLAAVEAYDRCWVEGRSHDLREYLHPRVVFTGPNFERLAEGVDACARSYVDFLAQATIHEFTPSDYVIDVADAAAVITYRWAIDYTFGGQRNRETGRDLLVWARTGDKWLITWRSQRPDPAS